MSLHSIVNGSIPLTSRSYLDAAQWHLPSTSRLALFALINAPVLIILLNALWQWIGPRDPSVPPVVFHWLPIIGSAIEYGNDPVNFFFRCREKYGDVFTFILFGRRMTVALGPIGNDFIFGGKASVLSAEDAYTHLTTPVFGKDVVFDVPNEVLMEQKKFVKVSLSMDKFRSYIGMIEDEVDEFMKHDPAFKTYQMKDINEWSSFEADDLLQNITILTASRTLQGKEVRGNLDKSFAQLYTDLDGGFTPINFLFPNLPLESYRKRDRAHRKMSAFYVDCIQKRRADPQNSDPDIISSLLNQKYRDGRPLKDHEIAHIMIALLMAGQHTSSASGSWTLMHLAANPDIAPWPSMNSEALYQEQLKYFQTPDGKLRSMTYEEMRELPFLDAVIRETLRMHPPIHSIMRVVRDDIPVPPTLSAPSKDEVYVIPKGHVLLASPAVSQMDPGLWAEPLKWNPYRWTNPDGTTALVYSNEHGEKIDYGFGLVSKGTGSHYQPFGAGRHRCIGEQFAYLQLGTVMTTIIRKIEMRMEKVPDHNYHTLITMPKKPTKVLYRRRCIT